MKLEQPELPLLFSETVVPDIFFAEYLSQMPSSSVKVYLYIIFLVLTTYFHIETICAYINQLHGKSKENIVSFKDKKISERIKLLLDEFMQYIKNPIKIIK